MKPILFTLTHCPKCEAVKGYLRKVDYSWYSLPHDFKDWQEFDIKTVKEYGIFEDIQENAPILIVGDKKIIGQLRIKKWVQDEGFVYTS